MECKDINEFTECEYYNVSCGGICDQCTLYGNTSTSITKCSDVANCFIKNLYKQVQDKKQQYEELRQFHNSCCEEFKQEVNLRIDAYNKLSRDFFNSKYCNTEHCKQLQEKEKECKTLKNVIQEFEKYIIKCIGLYFDEIECKETLEILDNAKQFLNKTGE